MPLANVALMPPLCQQRIKNERIRQKDQLAVAAA
jgi:hypothetical protein